ncbi:MAG: hypothetical protein LUF04_02015 [Bacteroides sp.]|nr:hypothetical protein [Bacteroides sp.]
MKVKVIKRFRDKYDPKKIYEKGEELTITKKRYNEILKVGEFVEEITEESEDDEKSE